MDKVNRGLSTIGAVILVAVLFSSCYNGDADSGAAAGSGGGKKVTIRFAHNWSGRDGKARYFEPFLKKIGTELEPGYLLHVEASNPNEYATDIKSKIATGDVPDVYLFWATDSLIRSVINLNAAMDIRLYLDASTAVRYEEFNSFAWNYTEVDGIPYAVPMEVFYGLFLANHEIFDRYNLEIPRNREEFAAVSEVFLRNGHIPLAVSSQGGDPGHLFFSALSLQYGEAYYSGVEELRDRKFNLEVNRDSARTVEWLAEKGYIPTALEDLGTYNQMVALYNREESPMIYTFPWVFTEFSEEVMESTWVHPLPDFTLTGEGQRDDLIGGVAMALFINPKAFADETRRPAIITLVDRLLSEESFMLLSRAGMIPSRKLDLEYEDSLPLFKKVYEFASGRIPVKAHEIYFPDSRSLDAYRLGIDYLFTGTIDADGFIDLVQDSLDSGSGK